MLVGEAWAARSPSGLTSVGPDSTGSPSPLKSLSAATFTLPLELGYVQESSEAPNSGKTVIHIQDAHCNYAAQKSIAEILNYLTAEYGIYAVNCEGGAESYDLSPFTAIPEKDIREKTADFFVKEGVVSAAEYYAVNNPEKVNLWGVEDPDLYLKNLKVYRDSLAHKNEVDRYIKSIGYILDNLKRHIYPNELLELDKYYTGYKDGKITFKEYILYLINMARKRIVDIKSFSNVYLLSQTLADEDKINFKRANNEKDEVVDKLKKSLSRNELEDLMVMVGKLKAERVSQTDFYAYLVKKAKSVKLDISGYPELQKYIVYISLYSAIDRTKVAKEIDALEDRIKTSLYENDTQRELGVLSKNLAIMKNMFNISLTRDDYIYYKEHRETFDAANYISFIDKKAPLYKISAVLDKNIGSLDVYRDKMDLFYECSMERDKAFIKNIKFTDHDRPNSIIITGGFHTENLREMFKDEKISYISIMPKFVNEKGYESPYMKRLAGQRTALENVIDTAIPAVLNLAVVNMLSQLGIIVEGKAGIEHFRLAVAIVAGINKLNGLGKVNLIVKEKNSEDDKLVVFTGGGGGTVKPPEDMGKGSARNFNAAEAIAGGETVIEVSAVLQFEFKVLSPASRAPQKPAAPNARTEAEPTPPGGGLIGKVLDIDGNVITGGFDYKIVPGERKVLITHPKIDGKIEVALSDKVVPSENITRIIRSLKDLMVSPAVKKVLTDAELKGISSVIGLFDNVDEIIAIKPNKDIAGFMAEGKLFISESIVFGLEVELQRLAFIHELGEASPVIALDILKGAIPGRDLSEEIVPGLGKTYRKALIDDNLHALWRGPGEKLRTAFIDIRNRVTDHTRPDALIKMLENRMREKDFVLGTGRTKDIPVPDWEKALTWYNYEVGRKGEELIYGLQDRLDKDGNAQFTHVMKALTDDLRQGMMNLYLIHSRIDMKSVQAAIGREAADKLNKKFGLNTNVFYFERKEKFEELKEEIEGKLDRMVEIALENPNQYPKISVDCVDETEIGIVNNYVQRKKLQNIIAIVKDFEEGIPPAEVPDEMKILIVHSAILNDRRLRVDFKEAPEDLFASRAKILRGLGSNGIINMENIRSKVEGIAAATINDITAEEAEKIMEAIWNGSVMLHCSKINWKTLDDFKNAQRQLLQSV
ncbi:MAG: hypothetical protein NTY34_02070 [Candidatus Omnitrophica bacterium]|nr:hypothetical protein [Candidatus Omnitrophota bacterium]